MKYFKLGEKASSFYDPTTKMKLTPGVVASLEPKQAKGRKIADARRAGHIVEVDADDYSEYQASLSKSTSKAPAADDDNGEMNEAKFAKLSSAEMKEYLLSEYENDEAEVASIQSSTKAELTEKYKAFEGIE